MRTSKGGGAVLVLGLVAFVAGIGACSSTNSVSSRIDRIDSANGVKVAVTSCDATPSQPTADGIPQTVYTAKGTLESTSGDNRIGVKVRVSFLDGNKEFYDSDTGDTYSVGGIGNPKANFSFSVTLSDEVTELQCKGSANVAVRS